MRIHSILLFCFLGNAIDARHHKCHFIIKASKSNIPYSSLDSPSLPMLGKNGGGTNNGAIKQHNHSGEIKTTEIKAHVHTDQPNLSNCIICHIHNLIDGSGKKVKGKHHHLKRHGLARFGKNKNKSKTRSLFRKRPNKLKKKHAIPACNCKKNGLQGLGKRKVKLLGYKTKYLEKKLANPNLTGAQKRKILAKLNKLRRKQKNLIKYGSKHGKHGKYGKYGKYGKRKVNNHHHKAKAISKCAKLEAQKKELHKKINSLHCAHALKHSKKPNALKKNPQGNVPRKHHQRNVSRKHPNKAIKGPHKKGSQGIIKKTSRGLNKKTPNKHGARSSVRFLKNRKGMVYKITRKVVSKCHADRPIISRKVVGGVKMINAIQKIHCDHKLDSTISRQSGGEAKTLKHGKVGNQSKKQHKNILKGPIQKHGKSKSFKVVNNKRGKNDPKSPSFIRKLLIKVEKAYRSLLKK